MLQNFRALLLLILALPGLILAPGSAFVVCLCDAGPAEEAPMSCCSAPSAGAPSAACAEGCDDHRSGLGCCGNPEDCDGCLEIELDEVLLATVDGPQFLIAPTVPMASWPVPLPAPPGGLHARESFIRPPPPSDRPTAGLLPGVRPLRI